MKESKKKKKIFLWTDLLLAVLLFGLSFLFYLPFRSVSDGETVTILENDRSETYPLKTDRIVETEYSGAVIIRNGKVHLEHATCPDKICEAFGEISKSGESIICVPNKLVVKINGKSEVDGIAG